MALVGARGWLGLVGGLVLVYLGIRTILAAAPAQDAAGAEARRPAGLVSAWASTFVLTLGNPSTILSFTAAFAALGVGVAGSGVPGALALVAGVVGGSALWWLVLSYGVSLVRHRLSEEAMVWIDRVSGAVILAFGVIAALAGLGALGVRGVGV